MLPPQTITALEPPSRHQSSTDGDIDLAPLTSEENIALNHPIGFEDEWDKKEGWPVVLAGSTVLFVSLGLIYSYGIVQLHLYKAHLARVSTLAFIGSVGSSMSPLIGMIVARIIGCIGYRATACMGGLFLGLGEFTAGFATKSVPAMFVTQGVIFGIGAGLLFLPAATVPSLWFKRKRGLATGVVYAGAGVGSATLALSLDKLITTAGLANTLKFLGVVAWSICIPASYFLRQPMGRGRAMSPIQWHLFRNLRFILMLFMGAIATFPLSVPPFLLPLCASSIGLSSQAGAGILASWNLASAVGRIGMGLGADAALGPVNSMIVSLCVVSISSFTLWPFANSFGLLIFFSILNGIGAGGFFSLMPVVTGAVFGDGEIANITSMLITSWTFGYFMGAPIAGLLLEVYGSTGTGLRAYRPAIFYAGSMTLLSAVLMSMVRFMMNRKFAARV
ncbi:putative monocarboxylate transporter [Corynespora cassiicola Philippines]|uniref:Putative monocarboxylate transporter n=1 Tax=Corynespora cassiicola Philippines TaxID=1448308 RepID=A0A2T2NJ30_CORCC|nr:putative monocarboxylate transporter [Corynespora cassiicola Philippines]